jgi:primosomal protein N' (replication factor Y)
MRPIASSTAYITGTPLRETRGSPLGRQVVDTAELPEGAELLGPVDLPAGARRPAGISDGVEVVRMLVRVPRTAGLEMAAALRRGVATLSARRDAEPVRVQIDPLHVG